MSSVIRETGTAFDRAFQRNLANAQRLRPEAARARVRWLQANYATATAEQKVQYQGEVAALSKAHGITLPEVIRPDMPSVWRDGRAPATPPERTKQR